MQEALKFMESIEMRRHLEREAAEIPLSWWCDLVTKSRAGISEKAAALDRIAEKYPPSDMCNPGDIARDVHDALELTKTTSPSTAFMLTNYWRNKDDELPRSAKGWRLVLNDSEPYHTFEQAVEACAEEYTDDGLNVTEYDYGWCWNEICRYDLTVANKLEAVITYTVSESGVVWGYDWHGKRRGGQFSLHSELNLTTPFKLGDVISVDCRPFEDVFYAVVTAINYPRDCCTPYCIYINQNGRLDMGALKHKFHLRDGAFSPLLRAHTVSDPLSGKYAVLTDIGKNIERHPELAALYSNYLFNNISSSGRNDEKLGVGVRDFRKTFNL